MSTLTRSTQTGPIELFYEVTDPSRDASGLPVILGHSFLCSGEMWRHQVPALAKTRRVLNVDFRGHGRSAAVTDPFSIEDLADDLAAVLDAEGVDRAVWGGLSIGGMTVLRGALQHPERVAGLMVLDSHAGAETRWKRFKYRLLATGARFLGLRPFLPAITPLMFGRTTRREQSELVDEWEGRFVAQHVPSMVHGVGALNRRTSLVGRLTEIDVPALVLVGEEDRALRPALSEEMALGLPRAELVRIPRVGHLSALENPEAVTEAMESFLGRLG